MSVPPDGARRSSLVPVIAGLVLAAVIGFLIWYLLVRDGDDDATPLVPAGEVSVDSPVLDFGDVEVGLRSPTQTVVVTNGTFDAVRVEDVALDGEAADDYAVEDSDCLSARLEQGDACAVRVRFLPGRPGARPATLVLSLDGGLDAKEIALRGAGVGRAALVLDTSLLDFGARELQSDGAELDVVLTNVGALPLRVTRAALDGPAAADFRIARRAGCLADRTLEPGSACFVRISFRPSEAGQRNATLLLAHGADDAPARVELRGEGVGVGDATLTPPALQLGRAELGATGRARAATLANAGTGPFVIGLIAIGGPDATSFRIAGTSCETGQELSPDAACEIRVRLEPIRSGALEAELVVATDAPSAFVGLALSGTGVEAPQPETPETGETEPQPANEAGAPTEPG